MTSFVVCIAGFRYLRNDGWHSGAIHTDMYIKRRHQSGINITHCDAISALYSLFIPSVTRDNSLVWLMDEINQNCKIMLFLSLCIYMFHTRKSIGIIDITYQSIEFSRKVMDTKMVCQVLVWDCFVQVVLWCAMYSFSWNVGGIIIAWYGQTTLKVLQKQAVLPTCVSIWMAASNFARNIGDSCKSPFT